VPLSPASSNHLMEACTRAYRDGDIQALPLAPDHEPHNDTCITLSSSWSHGGWKKAIAAGLWIPNLWDCFLTM
jgi:hypothetical protein